PLVVSVASRLPAAFHAVVGAVKPLGSALKSVFDFVRAGKGWFQTLAVGILAVAAAVKLWSIATSVWSSITRIAAAVQLAWNTVMAANPIGLVILAIAALVAMVIYAWTHFKTFRDVVKAVWKAIEVAAMWTWNNILKPIFELWVIEIKV